jgi:L-threonylcarbamoyladenylate synthase
VSHPKKTRVLAVDPQQPDSVALKAAARVLLRGGLVAFATETVYGLGAVATDPAAVERIFSAKGRPAVNPVIVHALGVNGAKVCAGAWPDAADLLAGRFWPGPLTLVLERSPRIPEIVTAGRPTVAVRVPASRVARGVIECTGQPIAAPSANRSNRLSPTRAEHVLADLDGLIELVIDSGSTEIGLESTVLDLTSEPPRVLRPGPITKAELEAALSGRRVLSAPAGASADRPSSPGQMPVHYAPRTPAYRVESVDQLEQVADLSETAVALFGEHAGRLPSRAAEQIRLGSAAAAAGRLYEVLHRLDVLGVRSIIVVMPADLPEWQAVRDRLLRATRPLAERG